MMIKTPTTLKTISFGNERVMLVTATLVVLVLSLISSASATVKPYVFDNSQSHARALDDLVFLTQEPPEPEDSTSSMIQGIKGLQIPAELTLTQTILQQAETEYTKGLDDGKQSAMTQMLGYLKNSGVTQELAEILIDDIVDGAYQANQQVIEGLKIISSK